MVLDEEEGGGSLSNEKEEEIKSERLSVYELVWEASRIATWTYGMTELRALAKKGGIKGENADCILNLPVPFKDVASVVAANEDHFDKVYGPEETKIMMDVMKTYHAGHQSAAHSTIDVFNDEHQELECVFIIGVSVPLQAVIVSFRGSVTMKDFRTDLSTGIRNVPNALYGVEPNQPEYIGVHSGFKEYIYSIPSANRDFNDSAKNKSQAILRHATRLLEENPGYSLVCTGHSLGAALAILCAFEAAALDDPRIPKPVHCVSIACPRVGNLNLRTAVEVLEKKKKLRILRVENDGDVIPHMPQEGTKPCIHSWANNEYHHVGPKVILKRKGGYELHSKRGKRPGGPVLQYCSQLRRDVFRCIYDFGILPIKILVSSKRMMKNHSSVEYARRLEENKEGLQKKDLGDLYKERYRTSS